MKIVITLIELRKYDWQKVCKVLGLNEWCLAEGADPESIQWVTEEQAREIGIIPQETKL